MPGRAATAAAIAAAIASVAWVWSAKASCAAVQQACAHSSVHSTCVRCADLHAHATWAPLNASERAKLFVAAAAAGRLGAGMKQCASAMQPAVFAKGAAGVSVQGAAAARDLAQGKLLCYLGADALVTPEWAAALLGPSLTRLQSAAPQQREPSVGDMRALITLAMLREGQRATSPLMPYLRAFADPAVANLPLAWDPDDEMGAARLAALDQSVRGAVQTTRSQLANDRDNIVRAALDEGGTAAAALAEGLPCDKIVAGESSGCTRAAIEDAYSLPRFAAVFASLRSRDFVMAGRPLVAPVVVLMNHHEPPNVKIDFDTRAHGFVLRMVRSVRQGDELLIAYADGLCREYAMYAYGFVTDDMKGCSTTTS